MNAKAPPSFGQKVAETFQVRSPNNFFAISDSFGIQSYALHIICILCGIKFNKYFFQLASTPFFGRIELMVAPDASWSESRKTFGNLCSLLDLNLHLRLVMSSVPFWAQIRGWLHIEISYFWTDFGKIRFMLGFCKLIRTGTMKSPCRSS